MLPTFPPLHGGYRPRVQPSVFVNGRVVYENGKLTLVSIDEIRAKSNEYRDKIRKSLATIR